MNIGKTCIVAACKNSESYVLLKGGGGYIYIKDNTLSIDVLNYTLKKLRRKRGLGKERHPT